MPQIVEYNGARIEFPDGMPPAEIEAAIKRSALSLPSKAAAQVANDPITKGALDPTLGMSTTDRFLAGAGKAFVDLGRGVGQFGAGIADIVSPRQQDLSSLVTGKRVPSRVEEMRNEVAQSRQRDAALMNTTPGMLGNVTGNVAALLPTALLPGANTITGAATIGALTGLAQPSTSTNETATNTVLGGIAAPAAIGLVRGGQALYEGAKGLLEPFTTAGRDRIASRVLQEFAADPASAAAARATPGPTITGAIPTLSEAARDTGLATLERGLAQQNPRISAQFAQRAADNNAARVATIQRLAGDDASRAAAVAARNAASEDAYRAATQATYTVDGQLADLLKRPAIQQAMERAKTMAANQGRPFAFDVESRTGLGSLGNQGAQTSRQITGQGLQDLKMAMDEMLSDPASGFAGKAGDTIKNLRGQVVSWMEGANPAFKQARTAYAEASKPINAMDVGQRLLDKTTANMRDLSGNQRLQANAFARALNDEQTLVRQATGFKGANSLDGVLTPSQRASLDAVRGELETAANLASAANGPGSQTVKSLATQNALRRLIGPTGMPQSWAENSMLQAAMAPLNVANKVTGADEKIMERIARSLLDPTDGIGLLSAPAAIPNVGLLGAPSAQRYLPAVGLLPLMGGR